MRTNGERAPWRITFVTNPDDCNLRCPFCRTHSPLARQHGRFPARPPRRMAMALVRRVLDAQRENPPAEVIPSTVGEPLLYPDFEPLLDACSERGIGVNLTTNGTFPGRGAAAWAERIVPVATDVKISWLGARAETAEALMPGLSFQESLENVRVLVAARDALAKRTGRRCQVSFQVTALESNLPELPDVVTLAASLGVDRVKVNQLQVHFESLAHLSLRRSAESIQRWNEAVRAARLAAQQATRTGREPLRLQNFAELEPDPSQPAPRGPCPFLEREAWIWPDGRLLPCCAPAAVEGHLGEFGSVADRPLAELWQDAAYRSLVERVDTHPICRVCNFRRMGGV